VLELNCKNSRVEVGSPPALFWMPIVAEAPLSHAELTKVVSSQWNSIEPPW